MRTLLGLSFDYHVLALLGETGKLKRASLAVWGT